MKTYHILEREAFLTESTVAPLWIAPERAIERRSDGVLGWDLEGSGGLAPVGTGRFPLLFRPLQLGAFAQRTPNGPQGRKRRVRDDDPSPTKSLLETVTIGLL